MSRERAECVEDRGGGVKNARRRCGCQARDDERRLSKTDERSGAFRFERRSKEEDEKSTSS